MTDIKDPRIVHNEDVSGSDADIAEKAGRISIAGGHTESLADLEDPDAGKTAEEKAAIVRIPAYANSTSSTRMLTTPRTRSSLGKLISG